MRWFVIGALAPLLMMSCAPESTTPGPLPFPPKPAHLPAIPFPADNPITPEKAELGRHLFYDGRMSRDGKVPCSSCHDPSTAFSDAPRQISAGVGGVQGHRNSPTIVNSAYRKVLFWDGRASTLEEQAMAAFLSPAEMFADTIAVAELLRTVYKGQWLAAFGDTSVTMHRAMQAIATFERTIVSADSRYDRFVLGDSTALSDKERHGMQLFFSDRTKCASCHGGPDLTNDEFHSVGLFHHYFDKGRFEVTRNPLDEGRFKTPTLRNIALTPPYMAGGDSEDGLLETLADVVDHYDKGGTTFHNKDDRVVELKLSEREKEALVKFMEALTDSSILTNSRYQKP